MFGTLAMALADRKLHFRPLVSQNIAICEPGLDGKSGPQQSGTVTCSPSGWRLLGKGLRAEMAPESQRVIRADLGAQPRRLPLIMVTKNITFSAVTILVRAHLEAVGALDDGPLGDELAIAGLLEEWAATWAFGFLPACVV
jgi:hypothetical protein